MKKELDDLKKEIDALKNNADLVELWNEAKECLKYGNYAKCQEIINSLKASIAKKKARGTKR